jgi:hypothetical protein
MGGFFGDFFTQENLNELVPDRPDCSQGSVIYGQLIEDTYNVAFNGMGAQFQLGCYLKIGGALGHQTQDFLFPSGERRAASGRL